MSLKRNILDLRKRKEIVLQGGVLQVNKFINPGVDGSFKFINLADRFFKAVLGA